MSDPADDAAELAATLRDGANRAALDALRRAMDEHARAQLAALRSALRTPAAARLRDAMLELDEQTGGQIRRSVQVIAELVTDHGRSKP